MGALPGRVTRSSFLVATGLLALLAVAAAGGRRSGPSSVLADLTEARRLAGDLRAQFNAFDAGFSGYEKLDADVLERAVENTNLMAQRLSFGPEHEAAETLRESLEAAAASAPAKDRCRIEALTARAVGSVREIQVLQAPHIAEASDQAMARLETKMDALDVAAKDAVKALGGLVDVAGRQRLTAAAAAPDQFEGFARQIVKLSHRNSNVRSLELSLKQKPLATARCDESLNELQDALAKEGFSATR